MAGFQPIQKIQEMKKRLNKEGEVLRTITETLDDKIRTLYSHSSYIFVLFDYLLIYLSFRYNNLINHD